VCKSSVPLHSSPLVSSPSVAVVRPAAPPFDPASPRRANELPTPLVWIEHWPEETTEGLETFELVVFSRYEVVEIAPYLRETRAWIGDATWKPLDRASVEILVEGKV
jgi:hypothetical protein